MAASLGITSYGDFVAKCGWTLIIGGILLMASAKLVRAGVFRV